MKPLESRYCEPAAPTDIENRVLSQRRALHLALMLGVPFLTAASGCGGGGGGGTPAGGNGGTTPAGGGSPQLTTTRFADGSGSIGIAPGWKLDAGVKGAASGTGPSGALFAFGIPQTVVASNVAQQFPDQPPASVFPGVPRVDFSDPVRAFLDFTKQVGASSGSAVTTLRTVEYVATPTGRAAYIRAASSTGGKLTESFGLYLIAPTNSAQALLYFSEVSA